MLNHLFHFEDCTVDLGRYELRRTGRVLKIEKIPMDLLILLLSKNGQLVTREEIIEKLWGKDVFLDTEQGINTAIRKIRQVLRDDPEQPRFVQTVVGRGYRFIAPVTITEAEGAQRKKPPEAPFILGPRRSSRFLWIAGLGVTVLLTVFVVGNIGGWRERLLGSAKPTRMQSVAVLPLENLSGDPAQDYFADGITEALITDLAKINALRVISRTSVMGYKGTKKPLPQIARELNVEAVVEGAVIRSGHRVRITAQLVHAPTDRHLWAEEYERDVRDILTLQGEVAAAIARQVQVKLTPREQASLAHLRPVNLAAYEAYLKGRYYWNQRTEAGLKKAIEYFQQTIEMDPTYALAYSGLADSYTALGYLSNLAPNEAFPKAKAAAMKALELDATLAEPHASLAYARLYHDWDWAEAEKEFRRAIALNPNYATAHHWYSVYLTAMGRPQEALAEIKRAQELDPLSLIISTDIGFELYYSAQYDSAIHQLGAVLTTNPNFPLAHLWLGRAYQQKGMYDEAIAEFRQTDRVLHDWPVTWAAIGNVYGLAGKQAEARKVLDKFKELSRQKFVTSYGVGLVYAGLGEREQAFAWLDRAYDERSHWLVWLKLDPRWYRIRQDPRFADLVRRVGLPP